MDGNEDAREIENCRQNCLDGNGCVGEVHVFRHQERCRAHDGRHDLTAGGGGSFDRASEVRMVAGLFHHGDGNGAGGNGVADGRAGDHAAQRRGDDRDLCRTACRPTGKTVCKRDKEVRDARALQERAEDDEQDDVGVADVDRGADDAVCGVEELIDDVLERLIEARVVAQLVIERVDEQRAKDAENRDAHTAAAQFDQNQNADRADDHVVGLDAGSKLDDGQGVEGKVQKTCRADQHQNDIVPRHGVDLYVSFFDGIGQKTDEDDHGKERGKARLGQTGEEQRHADAVQAECNHEDADNPALPALPDAGVGLTVIFAHDLVEVSLHLIVETGSHFNGVVGIFFCGGHTISPLNSDSRLLPRQGKYAFGQRQLRQEALP